MEVNTRKRPQARENASNQIMIGFSFASDWLRRWCKIYIDQSQSVVKLNQCNPTQLKIFSLCLINNLVSSFK